MSLGPAEVAKIAHLARLAIREEDAPAYARNLSAILELVEQMNAVDTSGVAPWLIRWIWRSVCAPMK
jgi:aspartyl-tRNA(Asn)/glutamyl-tRNA(Gln) amidotransferase subunit C